MLFVLLDAPLLADKEKDIYNAQKENNKGSLSVDPSSWLDHYEVDSLHSWYRFYNGKSKRDTYGKRELKLFPLVYHAHWSLCQKRKKQLKHPFTTPQIQRKKSTAKFQSTNHPFPMTKK